MATHPRSVLVGRESEVAQLREVTLERREHVLLAGDAGVGKTRMLTELRDVAVAAGWQVCAGHCLDFGESALPYLPFTEALGRLARDAPDVVEQTAAEHPALRRLQAGRRMLRSGSGTGSDAEPASIVERGEVFNAVHALLDAVAANTPLLLVIEDLHWADQSTRDLLSFLFSRPFAHPVAIIASYRSDDLHRRHPLRRHLAEWARQVARVQLGPLSDEAVRDLIGHLGAELGAELGADRLAGIVERAEGNAFFVEELVGAASGADSLLPNDLPDELADVLLVRLDRLDDDARHVVRAASAAGRRIRHDQLLAVSGLPAAAVEAGLRAAVEMNVLVASTGHYAFRHALLGEAVYDDLLPGERGRLHSTYMRVLREGAAAGTAAELARHARLAHDPEVAVEASIRAGNEAAEVGGPDEAAQHYLQALELMNASGIGDVVEVSKVAVSAAEALAISGHAPRAAAVLKEQLERLDADAPPDARARMLAARTEALYVLDSLGEDLVALSREAVALLPDDKPKLRAKVIAGHARILSAFRHFEEAQSVGLEAFALAERHGMPDVASDAITTVSGLRNAPAEVLRRSLEEAVDRARRDGALHAELRGRFLLGRSFQDWGEYDQAARWFAGAIDRAASCGVPWAPYGFESRWQLGWIRFVEGEWDDALDLLTAPAAGAPPLSWGMLEALRLYVLQGRGRDVRAEAFALRRFWASEGAVAINSASVEMFAAGRNGDAAAVLAVYGAVVESLSFLWGEWFPARLRFAALGLAGLADAAAEVPSAEREELLARARELEADGRAVVERYDDPTGYWGPEGEAWQARLRAESLRARWRLGEPVDVVALEAAWSECVAAFERFGHVFETALCRLAWAEVLRAGGEAGRAREQLDRVQVAAELLGASTLLPAGSAPGSAQRPDAEQPGVSLTARESEILTLVAQGRSNGEIGQQLFISTKTVSVHVSNILGKLGASGRTEAAAIGRRLGLLAE